jgi:hypothetical protein
MNGLTWQVGSLEVWERADQVGAYGKGGELME